MSFTAEVKDEASRVAPTCENCLRAELSALVRIEGTLTLVGSGACRLEVSTETASVARSIIKLMHSENLKTELTMRRSVLNKASNYLITVPSQPHLAEVLDELGILTSDGIVGGIEPSLVEKQCCAAAYLRGAFLGGGFIADPRGDSHFELTMQSESLAQALVELLARYEIKARINHRRNSYIVYIKGGDYITMFLALIGAHRSVLAIENVRVIKSVRSDVNRKLNAEMANQAKASEASVKQRMAIQKIRQAGKFQDMPQALRDFAKLREENPFVSLRELGELASPPLSKSAVYHRVRRIEEIASNL
jgi:cell division protein WhiA